MTANNPRTYRTAPSHCFNGGADRSTRYRADYRPRPRIFAFLFGEKR